MRPKRGVKLVTAEIAAYIEARKGLSGIIYCTTRKECEMVADALGRRLGFDYVQYYHAGLEPSERDERYKAWIAGTTPVIVATVAFGMVCVCARRGQPRSPFEHWLRITVRWVTAWLFSLQGIDKPDVRFVIHYAMPRSISEYYQEAGRAGRDGGRAECILFYSQRDRVTHICLIRRTFAVAAEQAHVATLYLEAPGMMAYDASKVSVLHQTARRLEAAAAGVVATGAAAPGGAGSDIALPASAKTVAARKVLDSASRDLDAISDYCESEVACRHALLREHFDGKDLVNVLAVRPAVDSRSLCVCSDLRPAEVATAAAASAAASDLASEPADAAEASSFSAGGIIRRGCDACEFMSVAAALSFRAPKKLAYEMVSDTSRTTEAAAAAAGAAAAAAAAAASTDDGAAARGAASATSATPAKKLVAVDNVGVNSLHIPLQSVLTLDVLPFASALHSYVRDHAWECTASQIVSVMRKQPVVAESSSVRRFRFEYATNTFKSDSSSDDGSSDDSDSDDDHAAAAKSSDDKERSKAPMAALMEAVYRGTQAPAPASVVDDGSASSSSVRGRGSAAAATAARPMPAAPVTGSAVAAAGVTTAAVGVAAAGGAAFSVGHSAAVLPYALPSAVWHAILRRLCSEGCLVERAIDTGAGYFHARFAAAAVPVPPVFHLHLRATTIGCKVHSGGSPLDGSASKPKRAFGGKNMGSFKASRKRKSSTGSAKAAPTSAAAPGAGDPTGGAAGSGAAVGGAGTAGAAAAASDGRAHSATRGRGRGRGGGGDAATRR